METKKNIASTLQKAKEERGKSMEAFSAELDIAKSTLQTYMKGEEDSNPTINTLRLIADKLHTTVVDVLSGPQAPERDLPRCQRCLWSQVEKLHPALRELMDVQLETYQVISRSMCDEDKDESADR